MGNSLEQLLAEGVISEILSRVKSGKEADVYTVRQGGKVVAAKVYKDHAQRSFKNNAVYQEGRQVRNSRSQRAMDRGSRFGKEAAEEAWKSAEANTIYKLHAAGVRVPTPVMFLEGVLFMELILDENGYAAPRLIDTQLSADQANRAYHDMLTQLVRMLCCDLIHGDLSPYNVLWAATGPTIIDFPQSISASHNNSSERFFLRDARNILDYFAGIDPRLRSRSGDAAEIWRAYVRRELTPDFVPSGRPARPDTRPRFEADAPRATGHRGPPPSGGHRGPPQSGGHRGPSPSGSHRGPSPSGGHRGPPQSGGHRGPPPSGGHRGPPTAAGHRGPPPHGARPNGQRNGGGNSKPFSPRERPPAPSPARGPRRPEVIVLRRSPKSASAPSSGSPNGAPEAPSPLTAESRFTSARPRGSYSNESDAGADAHRKRRRRRG